MSSELPDASRVFSSCATLDDGVAHVASQSAEPFDEEELLVRQLEDLYKGQEKLKLTCVLV